MKESDFKIGVQYLTNIFNRLRGLETLVDEPSLGNDHENHSIQTGSGSQCNTDGSGTSADDDKWRMLFQEELNESRNTSGQSADSLKDIPLITFEEMQILLKALISNPSLVRRLNDCVLDFWSSQTHSQLFDLANAILAIPGTQVSVERLFSQLKFVVNHLRLRLKDEQIKNVMLIRGNRRHIL